MKIFIISLKHALDRRQAIAKELDGLGIQFEFVDAVVGADIDLYDAKVINLAKIQKFLGRNITNGEIGCALSHASIYQKMIDEKISDAIVLEDDAIITPEFAECVKNDSMVKSEYEFVMFYHYNAYALNWLEKKNGVDYYRPAFMPFSTAGYYLNLKTAMILKDSTHPITTVADWPIALHERVNMAVAVPRIIQHPAEISQTFITGRPKTYIKHRLRMLFGCNYLCRPDIYGSLLSYCRRTYFRFMYKALSKTIHGK